MSNGGLRDEGIGMFDGKVMEDEEEMETVRETWMPPTTEMMATHQVEAMTMHSIHGKKWKTEQSDSELDLEQLIDGGLRDDLNCLSRIDSFIAEEKKQTSLSLLSFFSKKENLIAQERQRTRKRVEEDKELNDSLSKRSKTLV